MHTTPMRFGALYVVQVSKFGMANTVTPEKLSEIAKKAVDGAYRQDEKGEIRIKYAPIQDEIVSVALGLTDPASKTVGAVARPMLEATGGDNILAVLNTDKWDYQEPVITNDKLETGLKASKAHFWRLA